MKIALCDDEKLIFDQLERLLKKFTRENNIETDFLYFAKPSELFSYMQGNEVDLIFMDLEYGNETEDGIGWTKRIKEHFPHTITIILTAYEKRYKEGYEARAFRFMTKPICEEELFAYLHVSLKELRLTESISLTRRGIPHHILIKNLLKVAPFHILHKAISHYLDFLNKIQ